MNTNEKSDNEMTPVMNNYDQDKDPESALKNKRPRLEDEEASFIPKSNLSLSNPLFASQDPPKQEKKAETAVNIVNHEELSEFSFNGGG